MNPPAAGPDADRVAAVRAACDRFVAMHGPTTIADELHDLIRYAGQRTPDRYGEGAVLDELEGRVAELLGTEAAVFMPSGTMAQQIALRIWADESGVDTVALHALSHLEQHEAGAVWELHHLRPRYLTGKPRLPTVDDLARIPDRLGTLTLELPLRECDYTLPEWDDLVGLCAAGRERGARVHLDGARLWESTLHFGRSLAEISALADSVYVSFYKILGGLSGAALAGPAAFVAQARRWQQRHGGRLVTQYPAVLSALRGLDEKLPRIPAYVAQAARLAQRLGELPGLRCNPVPPHCNGFVAYVEVPAPALREAALGYAQERRVWPHQWLPTAVPGWSRAECVVGEATLAWTPPDYADVVAEVVDRARAVAR